MFIRFVVVTYESDLLFCVTISIQIPGSCVRNFQTKAKKFTVAEKDLEEYLGPIRYQTDKASRDNPPGVITGLAWTAFGGDILTIETIPLDGKGFKLGWKVGHVVAGFL